MSLTAKAPPLNIRSLFGEDGGHWYTQSGEPAYTVASKAGTPRPTTLRDARKLGLVPSVTSILGLLDKPGLNRWKQEQVLLAALTLPRNESESEESYLRRIVADSQEHGREAAERGTAIHDAVERSFSDPFIEPEFRPAVEAVRATLEEHCGEQEWIAEQSFASPLGYGGRVDLHAKAAPGWVVDFKTKDFGKSEAATKKFTWPEQAIQLAAYSRGLLLPDARLLSVFISRDNPGVVVAHEWPRENANLWWRQFECLLEYWRLARGYDSRFGPLAQQPAADWRAAREEGR